MSLAQSNNQQQQQQQQNSTSNPTARPHQVVEQQGVAVGASEMQPSSSHEAQAFNEVQAQAETQVQVQAQRKDEILVAEGALVSANQQQPQAAFRNTSNFTSPLNNRDNNTCSSSPSFANPDTRTHVVGELYDTERSYVESLQILVEKYIKPLKSLDNNRMLIESSLVDEIFYTIPEILQHHENFLSALQSRFSSDWDTSQVIGNVFIEAFTNQQIIDTYTAFINNWKNARQAIKIATQAKPAFERFLEATSREHRNKLTLDALLIMPVQRIPRYELLIKELLKHTAEDHPDYGPLMEAQKEIHELALKIDRAEKEMIHQEQLKDLESMIEGHVELQNPQRDFIRYDLVTIIGHSSLTVTKKERVLFLFCDLLIMTSVKKKASRRSNLQTAFANSANDLSLLEGNKFKLLMRVPLDHIEVRLSNDQIQIQVQHQYQEQQHQLHLEQQSKYLQEKKSEVEGDLYILQQIENLSFKLIAVEKTKLSDIVSELTNELRQKLFNLERNELKMMTGSHAQDQQAICQNPSQLPCGHISHSPSSVFTHTSSVQSASQTMPQSPNYQQYCNSPILIGSSSSPSSLTSGQQDSNMSLEFLINSNQNSSTKAESLLANMSSLTLGSDSISGEQGFLIGNQNCSDTQISQQLSHCETLVVTFASIERRQAFLLAFIEAKQQRYRQQHQQHFPRMYRSSVTLKLSHSPDRRSLSHESHCKTKLQHQDNFELSRQLMSTNKSSLAKYSRHQACLSNQQTAPRTVSSASSQQPTCATTIVHQMSAPQSSSIASTSDTFFDGKEQQEVCHCSAIDETDLHHHHQLMHQTNKHPASLDTVCCNDQHDNHRSIFYPTTDSLVNRCNHLDDSILIDQNGSEHNQYLNCTNQLQLLDCKINNSDPPKNPISERDDSIGTLSANKYQKARLVNQVNQLMFFSPSPKFVLALPVNFLTSQHPALQFACSTLRHNMIDSRSAVSLSSAHKSQTVQDNLGQIWLCMSNGYVSHVALMSIKRSSVNPSVCSQVEGLCSKTESDLEHCSNFIPVIQAAGDICKSQINCAAQVGWMKKISYPIQTSTKLSSQVDQAENCGRTELPIDKSQEEEKQKTSQNTSVSPPINIKQAQSLPSKTGIMPGSRFLSESAPSHSDGDCIASIATNSASTTRLEVPTVLVGRSSSPSKNGKRHTKNSQKDNESTTNTQTLACQNNVKQTVKSRLPPNLPTAIHQSNFRTDRSHLTEAQRTNHSHTHGHHHHHHHHHHHNHHYNYHRHGQHFQQQISHHNQQILMNNHASNMYSGRHNTVPLGELRKALKQQNRLSESCSLSNSCNQYLAPPSNTPDMKAAFPSYQRVKSLDLAERGVTSGTVTGSGKKDRSVTPPASYSVNKSFRSARLLRHQASLKTSSILAKLVSSASKRSSYLRKSGQTSDKYKRKQKDSDLDDNEADIENENSEQHNQEMNRIDNNSPDNNLFALATSSDNKLSVAGATRLDENSILISPLSSASSLASTNSSMTVNSVCASSPNHSCCDLQAHSMSTTLCARPFWLDQPCISRGHFEKDCGLRSRSATVPSQSFCFQTNDVNQNVHSVEGCQLNDETQTCALTSCQNSYKISELIGDASEVTTANSVDEVIKSNTDSSLWLGCDDGSLIIIQCLDSSCANETESDYRCFNQQDLMCGNKHSEIKLGASISDISNYEDELVFVALSNGQLAVFSRDYESIDEKGSWLLVNPRIITVATYELEFTSKLCLLNNGYLWYSYGRNIFIFNIKTLKLESTIMVPKNDPSLQFSIQSLTIDQMEPTSNHAGVWISFRNSYLIQLYDADRLQLIVEVNLFEPINKLLSYGNEILRQHKMACLKATSLLNIINTHKQCDTLFIGTSAGLILYLNTDNQQLSSVVDKSIGDWQPQLVGLRHGHSGPVKFLHLVESGKPTQKTEDGLVNNDDNLSKASQSQFKEMYVISGGKGYDLYGPGEEHQVMRQCKSVEDNSNHLILWHI